MPFKIENLGYGEAHIADFEVSGVEYTLIIMEIISKRDSSVVLPENYSFDINNFFEVSFDAKNNLYPIDFKMHRDGKGVNPREHSKLCDRGERVQPTKRQLER
ncbi:MULTISPECIES: hypothetical protein [Photorhabdus]|uniref:hypothetical protein n=1 Tax=Photorhabdus TaxID=29487 RepID=UPI0011BF7640|nr:MULTISPECIES: hypothetical protein [Photorhabdus]MCT8341357.1 hypothetical protein [Photorhabdus kleinii]